MSYYDDGNLARQLAGPAPRLDPLPRPRDLEAEKKARQAKLVREAAIRKQYKVAGRAHAKAVLHLITVFVLVGSVAGFIVWRSAKITEMSFVNAGLSRQIGELDRENSLLQDRIAKKASLQTTREQATEQLGMQKATSEQIHYVSSIYFQAGDDKNVSLKQGRREVLADNEWLAMIEAWVKDH
ncbi:MAG: hypothetical protein GX838_01315 [Clostridiaceae bacterium]|nr:hypothetical protein [Clostridiaceae bacterium]